MKSIEQLIDLSKNPYYQLSPEEKERLDSFLAQKSDTPRQQKKNGKNSERNIPATVLNKNVVQKETGKIPTINNVVREKHEEVAAVEEIVHPDAVK